MSEEDKKPDLDFITSSELMVELLKRHPTAFFIGIPASVAGEAFSWQMNANGELQAILGLIEIGKYRLCLDRVATLDEEEPDNE